MADQDTAEYSSSKAPDVQKHAQEREGNYEDWRLIPGGVRGSAFPQGMEALDHETVPSGATDAGLGDYGSSPSEPDTAKTVTE